MDFMIKNIIIQNNKHLGRFLVTARDFKAGEIIFRDKPLTVGPTFNSELLCVNCHSLLSKKLRLCSTCKLAPLCGMQCENHQGSHNIDECNLFSKIHCKFPSAKFIDFFHILTIIRCLMLRYKNENEWKSLMNLENHIEKRRHSDRWNYLENSAKVMYNLDLINQEDLDEDIIQKICGVLDVNSFEIRTPIGNGEFSNSVPICGIYPTAALMAHNCTCNVHLSVDDCFNMIIRANTPLEKGTTIFYNYTHVLLGTIIRMDHLRQGKYFECHCDRCMDPSEFGTHMSSIKCFICSSGLILMKNPITISQFSSENTWMCNNCNQQFPGDKIKQILDDIIKMDQENESPDDKNLELLLTKASKVLPESHYIMIDIKQRLAGVLRDIIDRSHNTSKKLHKRKLQICKEFLELLDKIAPGISRLKAVTNYEIYKPIVYISNKEFESMEISSTVFLAKLEEAQLYLKSSIKDLLLEPPSSSESILCKRAMMELKDLKNMIDRVKILIQQDQNTKSNKKYDTKN